MIFADPAAVREAIADVRNDATETDFVVVVCEDPRGDAKIAAKGSGFDQMVDALRDDAMCWAFIRRTMQYDESVTTKFMFISFDGEKMMRMLRARLTTWSGIVQDMFSPYHVTLSTSEKSEVNEEHVQNIIETAAGRKNHVLNL